MDHDFSNSDAASSDGPRQCADHPEVGIADATLNLDKEAQRHTRAYRKLSLA